jgi:hypothetical protein
MTPSPTSRRFPTAIIAAIVALCSVGLGLLVPIYSDEVGWRFQARMAFDGGVDRFVAENCGLNTLAQTPVFMQPLRYATAAFNSTFADPLTIRLVGIACALTWLALLWALVGRLSRTPAEANRMRTIGFSLASLGLLPFMLVISRPEQPILLALTAAIFLATAGLNKMRAEDGTAASAIKAALVVLLGLIALGYHLKGIIFMPIFLAAAVFSSHGPKGRPWRIAAPLVLIGATALSVPYWIGRFRCPADPLLAEKLGRENIASVIFNADPIAPKVGKLLAGLNPFDYILLTVPKMRNMSNWLPPQVIGHGTALGWTILVMICWAACMLAAIGVLIVVLRRRPREPGDVRRLVFALLIAATILFWSVAQIHKNVYESALTVPLTIIVFVLAFTSIRDSARMLRLTRALSLTALGSAAISAVLLMAFYGPALSGIARNPGYIAAQKSSASVFGYDAIHADILATGKLCGISNDAHTKGLLVDDLTYIAYMNSWRPLHRTGILSDWNGSISDPAAYLRAHGSSGAVIGCRYLPPALQSRARRNGPYCCLDARF